MKNYDEVIKSHYNDVAEKFGDSSSSTMIDKQIRFTETNSINLITLSKSFFDLKEEMSGVVPYAKKINPQTKTPYIDSPTPIPESWRRPNLLPTNESTKETVGSRTKAKNTG